MNDNEYNKLIEILKEKYFLEKDIVKEYTFEIKGKKYKTILGYGIYDNIMELSALLVIFQDETIDIDYIFEQTEFTSVINIIDNKYEVYIRKGVEKYKKVDYFPNYYSIFFPSMTFLTLLNIGNTFKIIELFFAKIIVLFLRFTIPPLGKKIWEYYSNPYNRVLRKKDVDKIPQF